MIASRRRVRNGVLFDNTGEWKDSKHDLEHVVCQYFQNLFTFSYPSLQCMYMVLGGIEPKPSDSMGRFLDGWFTADEIKHAVFDMGAMKASEIKPITTNSQIKPRLKKEKESNPIDVGFHGGRCFLRLGLLGFTAAVRFVGFTVAMRFAWFRGGGEV
ncbi:hypothetical protein Ddye_006124 [Dipteronia dyeriana]|uniref:Uncharacterized protein n=1 Tax=Dipteronia dyeriana TaxID=168575 RepID=A0AAE0CQG0_9ROSI|nr:hypothetical protein Ddye_006124 [Dipteronia dyeriana]